MASKMRVMPSRRRKVLCLGVSYANVEQQLSSAAAFGKQLPPTTSNLLDGSVRSAVDCVRAGILTQMDGRDLARCRSTEETSKVDVYTVSQEKGAEYRDDRHLEANFNRHDFAKSLRKAFGDNCRFEQIILDYFWIPPGWDVSHWSRSFFESTLASFVEEKVLKEKTGVVYLPFCLHCFKEVYVCFNAIRKYYDISFVKKGELDEVLLWKGTQQIDARIMQGVLGKKRSQEEKYCTFARTEVMQSMEDSDVSKKDLIELACTLEDFPDVRFIRLKQLQPSRAIRGGVTPVVIGDFRGRKDPAKVERGFDQASTSSTNIVFPRRQARRSAVKLEHKIITSVPKTPPSRKRNKRSRAVTPTPGKNTPPRSTRANKRRKIVTLLSNGRARRSISPSLDRFSEKNVIPGTPSPYRYNTRSHTSTLHSPNAGSVTPERQKQSSRGKTSVSASLTNHLRTAVSPVPNKEKVLPPSETPPVPHRYPTRNRTPHTANVARVTQEMSLKQTHDRASHSHSPCTVAVLPTMEQGKDEQRAQPKNLFPTTTTTTTTASTGVNDHNANGRLAASLDSQPTMRLISPNNTTTQALNNN